MELLRGKLDRAKSRIADAQKVRRRGDLNEGQLGRAGARPTAGLLERGSALYSFYTRMISQAAANVVCKRETPLPKLHPLGTERTEVKWHPDQGLPSMEKLLWFHQ